MTLFDVMRGKFSYHIWQLIVNDGRGSGRVRWWWLVDAVVVVVVVEGDVVVVVVVEGDVVVVVVVEGCEVVVAGIGRTIDRYMRGHVVGGN